MLRKILSGLLRHWLRISFAPLWVIIACFLTSSSCYYYTNKKTGTRPVFFIGGCDKTTTLKLRSLRQSHIVRPSYLRMTLPCSRTCFLTSSSSYHYTNKKTGTRPVFFIGGCDKTRTCDLYDVNVTL